MSPSCHICKIQTNSTFPPWTSKPRPKCYPIATKMKQASRTLEEIYISCWGNWIRGPEPSTMELCLCRKYSMHLKAIPLPETGGGGGGDSIRTDSTWIPPISVRCLTNCSPLLWGPRPWASFTLILQLTWKWTNCTGDIWEFTMAQKEIVGRRSTYRKIRFLGKGTDFTFHFHDDVLV